MAQELIPVRSNSPGGNNYSAWQQEEILGGNAIRQFLAGIFKWHRLILSTFIVFTVGTGIGMYLKPPVRTATATLMLKGDRVPLQISGAAAANPKWAYSPQVMQSEVELIRSREVMEPVARQLLLEKKNSPKGLGEDKINEEDQLQAAINQLQSSTDPVAVTDTNVIQITYTDKASERAKYILELIVNQYIKQQAIIQTGSTTLPKFFEQERQRVGTELRKAEDALEKWQERNQTISIDEQISGQLRILADRENALQQTEADLGVTRAKLAVLQQQLSSLPERLVSSQQRIRNPMATKIEELLVKAEVDLQDLLGRYLDKNRFVQEKKVQIDRLRKDLAAAHQEEVIGSETIRLNPLRETLEQNRAVAQAALNSLASKRETLRKQIHLLGADLAPLREKKVGIGRLLRAVQLHTNTFELYSRRLEEARIATSLGEKQLGQVAILGWPHADSGTDIKQKIGLVIMAGFVGLVLGIAIAFGLEIFNNTLRTQEDVEQYLGLPLLAAVPDLRGRNLMLNS